MTVEIPTFCRICEASCGILVKTDGERVLGVRADHAHVHSQGFMCTKPTAMVEIADDPDRVLYPLRRTGAPGCFERADWDTALQDIANRLRGIIDRDGPSAVAIFEGNPVAFDSNGKLAASGFADAIGTTSRYGINGEDGAAFVAANALQFGSGGIAPRPDVWHTDFLLMLGANPWISKGSGISEPQLRKALQGITERGGRVVVVDPRRTETARHFEHLAVRPGTDAWLLLGILRTILTAGKEDREFIAANAQGLDEFSALIEPSGLEQCAANAGVEPTDLESLALAFAEAPSAVAYGRTGVCTQRFGTLNNILINALNAVTGNIERTGGALLRPGALDFARLVESGGMGGYAQLRSRTTGLPMVLGWFPSQSLSRDITEPGAGRVRALVSYAANPVLSSGAGGLIEKALGDLDLHVSLDIYINETNKHADYILPGTTFYERDDLPLIGLAGQVRPSLYATKAVTRPRGEARHEWRVFDELARRIGLGGAQPSAALRRLARLGLRIPPRVLLDAAIRTGAYGDKYGLRRGGWSRKRLLREAPHGVALGDTLPSRPLNEVLNTPDHRIRLCPTELRKDLDRLAGHADDPSFPLRLIGLRELKSHNSWMHNAPRLTSASRQPSARVHPVDAHAAGLTADGYLRIESARGSISVHAIINDEVAPGVVAMPHGWGHAGGWQRANSIEAANSNALASAAEADVEPLSGMSILSGIPIRIVACADAHPARDL